MTGADVVVIGGGIIGLSVGWRAAATGRSVIVVDPSPGQGASRAAAGMLAPVTEARADEHRLALLGLSSLRRWPAFAEELAVDAAAGTPKDLGLRREGTLQVAFDEDDRRALEELAAVHRTLGLESDWLPPQTCRELVPLLAPSIRGGLRVFDDWQVDPRRVVTALVAALTRRGGTIAPVRARGLRRDPISGSVIGVTLNDGSWLEATTVVLAAGVGFAFLEGLPPEVQLPIRPVKGEILRLRAASGAVPLPMMVRATVQGQSIYLVPRRDGEIVVGATMQEAGFDTSVRAGAVLDLLRAAIDLVPALGELPLEEALSGLRPATPDNAPLLGPTAVSGLHVAAGHFRNGVLLAPVTADAVVGALDSGALSEEMVAFSAERFS